MLVIQVRGISLNLLDKIMLFTDVRLDSKIDLLDPPDVVAKKIKKAEAAPGVTEGNGILAFVEYVLLPAAGLKGKREFIVKRERDGLEPLVYTEISKIHDDYKNDIVCPPHQKKKKEKKRVRKRRT